MLYFVKNEDLRAELHARRSLGQTIGLVPTMGALHEGHLSLIRAARSCDVVVVSLFVNPLQFNNPTDLEKYPRDLNRDMEMLNAECDILFAPEVVDLYPHTVQTTFNFGSLASRLEGKFRPGHFNGVAVVVSKLLNIIRPDRAYFGLKDLQQFQVIKTLVSDLMMDIEIIGCEILRESNGLAMSSRNERLSDQGRMTAGKIFEGLKLLKEHFISTNDAEESLAICKSYYEQITGLEPEYLEIINERFESPSEAGPDDELFACVAAYVEGVRLIDNIYLRSEK